MVRKTIICEDCKKEKPHHAHSRCKSCYLKEYYSRPEIKERRKNRERKHKMVTCVQCGELKPHNAHGLCKTCYAVEYRKRPGVKEKHAERERARRAADPEKYRAYDRERSHTEKRKKWRREYNYHYYRENQEQLKRYAIEYRQADSTRQTIYKQRRRNRINGLEVNLLPDDWERILKKHDYRCYYCKQQIDDLEMEHKIPASRGGGLTVENIVPSCGICNRRKKTMTVSEYHQYLIDIGETPLFDPTD